MQLIHVNTTESIHVMSPFFFSQNREREEIKQESANKVRNMISIYMKVLDTKKLR